MTPKPPMTLRQAMARQEGFYVPGSRSARNKNPGNMEYGIFAKTHGAIGTDGRYAIFSTAAEGFKAQGALLLKQYKGVTLKDMLNRWAPPVENDTNQYLENVKSFTGFQEDTVLTEEIISA